jgi:transglutaminase-like putative cysteine protease
LITLKRETHENNKIIEEISEGLPSEDYLDSNNSSPDFGPLKIIVGLFLVIIIVSWMIPYYYIKDNPHPKYIPTIDEVYSPTDIEYKNITINSYYDYVLFIDTTSPEIKNVADRIVSLACDYSENYIVCHTKALYYFVRNNLNYVRDPTAFEYVKTPLENLNNLGGDCDDASVLLASLLGSIGVRTRLVFIPGHVYVEAFIPEASYKYKVSKSQNWVALDATCINCEFGRIPLSNMNSDKNYINVN